ncbi:hypothetical protein BJ322DRAFT_15011 [Thelephora terrestris]|uniref:F-box domain-containing protein n=1 Tax=Thelephora terrestris TaxID=56493 RepID=A0A9P6HPP2_9AGAM|nr:hypothetical protein BJ322DRAFT_15011 [Thelephora terrestris]
MEQEIAAASFRLKSLINSFSPVNRLPPEVFTTILAHRWPGRDLISSTHVCRHWRTALLSSASLWAELRCAGEEQTFCFLQRAKTAPLHVYLRPRFSHAALRTFIAPQAGRIESLIAYPMIALDTTALCRDLSNPAPKLRTLDIAPHSASRHHLPTIFRGDLPELRRFSLERAAFDLTKFRTPNLTHFSLQYTAHGEPLMADLLEFLEQAPLLESLVMVAAGPLCDDVESYDNLDKIVHLPRLSQLKLVGRSARSGIICHLALPVGADVTLRAGVMPSQDGITKHFLPSSLEHIPMARNVTVIRFTIDTADVCSLHYIGPNGTIYIEASNAVAVEDGCFSYDAIRSFQPVSTIEVERILFNGFQGCVNQHEAFESPRFVAFRTMESLQSITLVDCPSQSLIAVLQPAKPEVVFPSLRTLTIHLSPKNSFSAAGLEDLLATRKERGVPLDTLIFIAGDEHERIPDDLLVKFRRYVGEVEFRLDP